MIFDIKAAFLIAGGLIMIIFWLVDYTVKSDEKEHELCNHCFADFQSTGKRMCIDCGLEIPIKKPHYPKHQR